MTPQGDKTRKIEKKEKWPYILIDEPYWKRFIIGLALILGISKFYKPIITIDNE